MEAKSHASSRFGCRVCVRDTVRLPLPTCVFLYLGVLSGCLQNGALGFFFLPSPGEMPVPLPHTCTVGGKLADVYFCVRCIVSVLLFMTKILDGLLDSYSV